jgi:hypothetical protein
MKGGLYSHGDEQIASDNVFLFLHHLDKSINMLLRQLVMINYLSVPLGAPSTTSANSGRIELIRSTENIIDTYLQALHNAKSRWHYFADINSLAVPFLTKSITEALSSAKCTGVKFRFVTEIRG